MVSVCAKMCGHNNSFVCDNYNCLDEMSKPSCKGNVYAWLEYFCEHCCGCKIRLGPGGCEGCIGLAKELDHDTYMNEIDKLRDKVREEEDRKIKERRQAESAELDTEHYPEI